MGWRKSKDQQTQQETPEQPSLDIDQSQFDEYLSKMRDAAAALDASAARAEDAAQKAVRVMNQLEKQINKAAAASRMHRGL